MQTFSSLDRIDDEGERDIDEDGDAGINMVNTPPLKKESWETNLHPVFRTGILLTTIVAACFMFSL